MSVEKTETSLLLDEAAQSETMDRHASLRRGLPTVKSLILNGGAVLTNTGSTARDHLANERTYLAWLRSSLALIGASLALLKWDATRKNATVGYMVAFVGVVVLVLSTRRYFGVMQQLEQGLFEPNVQSIILLLLVLVVAIVAAFVLHLNDSL